MAGLKEVTKKIASFKNTQKITRAMKMIAATKLRKAQYVYEQTEPYKKNFGEVMYKLAGSYSLDHPLFHGRGTVKKALVILFTSDRGLCAGFNSNVIKAAAAFAETLRKNGAGVSMSFFGKRGHEHFRRHGADVRNYYEGMVNRPEFEKLSGIAGDLVSAYLGRELDAVHIVFNEFKSAIRQVPLVQQLLPVSPEPFTGGKKRIDFLFEPSPGDILNDLVVRGVKFTLYRSLLNSIVAEQAARMNAMDSATNNCRDLIDRLTLKRNKARQAAITKELMEIVSGAEALKV
jgi:F-type H+-transporting ATPase subunit gamma